MLFHQGILTSAGIRRAKAVNHVFEKFTKNTTCSFILSFVSLSREGEHALHPRKFPAIDGIGGDSGTQPRFYITIFTFSHKTTNIQPTALKDSILICEKE